MRTFISLLVFGLFLGGGAARMQAEDPRPFIWVTAADRELVLEKVRTQPWARQQFTSLQARADAAVASHRSDPRAYLRTLPWLKAPAGVHPTLPRIGDNMASTNRASAQSKMQELLGQAVDCGVLYFLTGERAYAACAADVLQALVRALRAIPPSREPANGGWLYTKDHLYEARSIGAQIPIVYDFIASYLREPGVTVLDLPTGNQVPFARTDAQEVFRTYARLAVEHGMSDTNWPVLEMPSLAHNALALDDPAERAHWLAYVTHVDTARQDPLTKLFREFEHAGAVWPESFNYSNGVSSILTYIVALLRRQTPALELPPGFAIIPRSLVRSRDFRFPNGEYVRFGDGPRESSEPYDSLEIAYALATREADQEGMREFGGLLREAVESGRHNRGRLRGPLAGATVYQAPLALLWHEPEISAPPAARPPPAVTDELPFAGLVLQRNLAPGGSPFHGLMAAVSGAAYVHSHASGMALELYGAGQVLGANAGKGTYRTDEHENYRRLFAAYNGVIVNGASRSSGGWVGLGIDTVKPVSLEPKVGQAPVSPNHSFTLTAFTDKTFDGATATQERLVGIVRTSATTGYYVDVFRSRASGGTAPQMHDYLYHNIGDAVKLTGIGSPLALSPAPKRFQPAAGTTWKQNGRYLFPGWHFFKDIKASAPVASDVWAVFPLLKLPGGGAAMRVHLVGFPDREYATAVAPTTKDAPPPYDKAGTPVLVVRQRGAAWDTPFAAIFEPGKPEEIVIQSVKALQPGGIFSGFEIVSRLPDGVIRQYVLVNATADGVVNDPARALSFRGRYAVVTVDADGRVEQLYLGEGAELSCAGVVIRSTTGATVSAWLDLRGERPVFQQSGAAEFSLGGGSAH